MKNCIGIIHLANDEWVDSIISWILQLPAITFFTVCTAAENSCNGEDLSTCSTWSYTSESTKQPHNLMGQHMHSSCHKSIGAEQFPLWKLPTLVHAHTPTLSNFNFFTWGPLHPETLLHPPSLLSTRPSVSLPISWAPPQPAAGNHTTSTTRPAETMPIKQPFSYAIPPP